MLLKLLLDEKWLNGIANFGERPTVDGKKIIIRSSFI